MVTKAQSASSPNYKQLYRSQKQRMVAGVCGGIAEYLNVDPTVVRLVFVVVTLFAGSGFLVYLLLWLVVPNENSLGKSTDYIHQNVNEMKEVAKKVSEEIKGKHKSL
jgi:phage shock protein C